LQSLDAANLYLETYKNRLSAFIPQIETVKEKLRQHGYSLYSQEPLKITIDTKLFGYTGIEIAELLRKQNIEVEFADPDYLVLMLTPEIGSDGLKRMEKALLGIGPRTPILEKCPALPQCERVLSSREAMLSDSEILPIQECIGRILAVPTVGCPPAVPILVCGERITEQALSCFAYYGIEKCCVVK
jgi:arginine/lysine/ornithine decarboxylase